MIFSSVYCETPHVVAGFPLEAVNAYSSLFPVVLGIIGLVFVVRHHSRRVSLYVLASLLAATGVGSALWHATREGWALMADVVPGFLFFFLFIFFWMRRLMGTALAALVATTLTTLSLGVMVLGEGLEHPLALPMLVYTGALAALILALCIATWRKYGSIAIWGLVGMLLALGALVFRSLDAASCGLVPWGTHFMWHITLGAAGFIAFVFMYRMTKHY